MRNIANVMNKSFLFMLIFIILPSLLHGQQSKGAGMTAGEIIEMIKEHTGGSSAWRDTTTIDNFKTGDPGEIVTGIVTTFTPTMEVLAQAVENNCNLIISHEPTFYNHADEVKWLENDPVYKAKLDYINKHHIIIWRFHDHWHNIPGKPDGILLGMMDTLKWKSYQSASDETIFNLPETTVKELAVYLKNQLNIKTIRVVGDPGLKISKIAFLPGAYGGHSHVKALEKEGVQLLLIGEATEWEGIAYISDAVGQKRNQAMILLGHEVSEESGMKECAKWLRDFIPGLPIKYIPAGEPFWQP
ncbi:MAG: Nif3-like dinuclear metal center hexameric protein [Ignavibacteriaceae bacterium]|nr:Nif3-like dinuclear metal center hexameric protein [Ignavibacteriaceae bacterium]